MSQGFIHLSDVRHFVLDEADRMLDMGFIHDIKKIIPKLPVKRQTLLFSATMPDSIDRLAKTLLRHPKRVETTPSASVVETIKQELYKVDKPDKKQLLINILLKEKGNSVLIFSRTKHGADNIARILNRKGIGCESIHGNKSQNARIRALTNFKEGVSNVIVATDIAARGIDINQLDLVINYDMPDVAETYVHRIGRTGRAGNSGRAVTFCTPEDKEMLNDIEKLIGFRVPVSGCFVSQTANKDTLDDSASKPITKRSSKTQSRKQESVKITANDKNDRRNSHHIKEQKANVRSNKSSDRRSVKTQSGENRTTKTKQLVNNESKNNFNSVNVRQKVAKPADNRNKPKRMPSRFDNGGMF
jgi:ATP-dependent RNA helicase RhlE